MEWIEMKNVPSFSLAVYVISGPICESKKENRWSGRKDDCL